MVFVRTTCTHKKDRNLRYQGAAEMRADLQRLKRDSEMGRAIAASSGTVSVAQESGSHFAQPTSPSLQFLPCAGCVFVVELGGGLYLRSPKTAGVADSVFDDALKQALAVDLGAVPIHQYSF